MEQVLLYFVWETIQNTLPRILSKVIFGACDIMCQYRTNLHHKVHNILEHKKNNVHFTIQFSILITFIATSGVTMGSFNPTTLI